MAEPLQQGEIDALSADADRFHRELDEESYLHFAGLKETFDIAPIYERHERLTHSTRRSRSEPRSTANRAAASCGSSRARATSETS
jgi:hypothetical protein